VLPEAAWLRGVLGRCPYCGQGALFARYLQIAPRCEHCGADFSHEDAGDGATAFVTLIAGAIALPFGLILQFALGWPAWISLPLTIIVMMTVVLIALPAIKGALLAQQFAHQAGERGGTGRNEE
jgi:uncharacterized protein (DUF983 family)